jgi:hypothetical protein
MSVANSQLKIYFIKTRADLCSECGRCQFSPSSHDDNGTSIRFATDYNSHLLQLP